MANSTAARRYAEALVESCAASDEIARTREELSRFIEALEVMGHLRNVLENPVFTAEERTKMLDAVMTKLMLSDRTQRFVRLVAERDRIHELGDMVEAFNALADERQGRVRALVESASELSDAAQIQLRRALESRTGKTVELEIRVDPELIGGIRARVGSEVFDGTIRSQLDLLRTKLTSGDLRPTQS